MYSPTNPYITIEELAEELQAGPPPLAIADGGTEETEAKRDKWLRAIDRASRFVDEWTGETYFLHDYSVVPLTLTQFSRGVYGDKIFLPHKPVIAITRIDYGTETLVEGTDFVLGAGDDSGRIYSLRGPWTPNSPDSLLRIWGTFGYPQASPDVPPAGLPDKITTSTRLVAATYTGDNRKEFMGVDMNAPIEIVVREIPKTVFLLLGRRMPILT